MAPICVLLNGPPGSGKDTLADKLEAFYKADLYRSAFARMVKIGAHGAVFMSHLGPKAFEAVKNDPREEFQGLTPRQVYQAYAEQFIKPLFGPAYFANAAIHEALALVVARSATPPKIVLFTDLGFKAELEEAVKRFGADRSLVLQLVRTGRTYEADTRKYIDSGLCPMKILYNLENDPSSMATNAIKHISELLIKTAP